MRIHDKDVPLTAEENELIELWLDRPLAERTPEDLREFADWVVEHRPQLLPKGGDDAHIYLARLLMDR